MTPAETQKRKAVKRDPVPLKIVIQEVLEHLLKDRNDEGTRDKATKQGKVA